MGWFKSQMWKVLEWKDESQDTMVHRFDMQGKEIMSGSQLTVRESQAGVFVHQGKIADVFGPGQHKLTTRNLPILSAIGSIWYQGESRFKAELYFVNTKQFVDCKWGTNNPITMRDKEFGAVRVRAFGNYSFRVVDSERVIAESTHTYGPEFLVTHGKGIVGCPLAVPKLLGVYKITPRFETAYLQTPDTV